MNIIAASVAHDAEQAEKARLQRLHRAWRAYQGDMDRPLRVDDDAPDDNVLIGYPKTIVDKSVSYLYGRDGVTTTVKDESAQAWLDLAWKHAAPGGRDLLLQKLATNAGVAGHWHAKIQTVPGREFPRVIVLDPSTVFPEWDRDDIEDVWRYRIQWTVMQHDPKRDTYEPAVRRQIIERNDTGRSWVVVDEISTGGAWRELGRDTWPYEFAPIVGAQNLPMPNEYWGLADLEPNVLDLCDAINRSASQLSKVMRLHGFPKVWVSGMTAGQVREIDLAMDRVTWIPDADAAMNVLEPRSDLSKGIELLREFRAALHETTRIPEVATGKLENTGSLSGRALGILYGPLIELTEDKRRSQGSSVEDLARRLLIVGGRRDHEVTIGWPELIPSDPKEEAETFLLDLDMGVVSRQTVAEKRGYNWEQERDRIREEDAQRLDAPESDPLLDAGLMRDDEGTDVSAGS